MSIHHLFVGSAITSCAVPEGWRLLMKRQMPRRRLMIYMAGISLAGLTMVNVGYSGRNVFLHRETELASAFLASALPDSTSEPINHPAVGRQLFLKNCAHCHGANAGGEEGPDLHNLDWTDERIAARIRNGKKGQMTAFAGKLSSDNISDLIIYLRTLK